MNSDGSDITGVTFPVKISDGSVLEKYTQQGIKHIEKLDRFTIDQLISKIIIGKKDENNNRPIKIFWNFTI